MLGAVRAQAHLLRQSARHRGAELERDRADRHAGGLGVLALAAHAGGEGLAHGEGKAPLHVVQHAAGRGHTLAEHHLHAAGGRQAPVAAEGGKALRRLRGLPVQMQGLEQRRPRFAVERLDRHALAQAVDGAPHAGLQALGRGRAVELQHEGLFLLDGLRRVGPDVLHERAAGMKLIAAGARQQVASGRFESRNRVDAAAHAGRQVGGEVVHPLARAGPAALTARGGGIVARHGERRRRPRVAEVDGVGAEARLDLPHLRHLALRAERGDGEGLGAGGGGAGQPDEGAENPPQAARCGNGERHGRSGRRRRGAPKWVDSVAARCVRPLDARRGSWL